MDEQRRIKKNPSRSDDELGFSCLISRTDPNARLLISRVRIGLEVAERVGFEPTDGCPSPDFEFFENLGKHRKSVSFSRKIMEAKKRGSARLFSASHTPKTAQTQEIHRLEIGSKVLSKFSPGGQKSGTLERTQERTHSTKGIRDSSCR